MLHSLKHRFFIVQAVFLLLFCAIASPLQAVGTINNPIQINLLAPVSGDGYTVTATNITINTNGFFLITGTSTARNIIIAQNLNDVYLILSNAAITTGASPLSVGDNSRLILTVLGDNTLTSTTSGQAGLRVPPSATLIINGPDRLTVRSADAGSDRTGAAAIGGNHNESNGSIIINGGTIYAKAGDGTHQDSGLGAGIGSGGRSGQGQQTGIAPPAGCITINGGTITAIGGSYTAQGGSRVGGGAGIGGGGGPVQGGNNVCGIFIHGGFVTATGGGGGNTGVGAAGIGGGGATNVDGGGMGCIEDGKIVIGANAIVHATGGTGAAGNNGEDIGNGGGSRVGAVLRVHVLNQPQDLSVPEKNMIQLRFDLSYDPAAARMPVNGASGALYQWYILTPEGNVPVQTVIPTAVGFNTNALTIPQGLDPGTYQFYCHVNVQWRYNTTLPFQNVPVTSRTAIVEVTEYIEKNIRLESDNDFVFPNRVEGYIIPSSKTIRIINDGNWNFPVNELEISFSTPHFLLNPPTRLPRPLLAGQTQTIQLTTVVGLPQGTYITVMTLSDGDFSTSMDLVFIVTECEVAEVVIEKGSEPRLLYCEGEPLDLSNLEIVLTFYPRFKDGVTEYCEIVTVPLDSFLYHGIVTNIPHGRILTIADHNRPITASINYGVQSKTIRVGELTVKQVYFDVNVTTDGNGTASAQPTRAKKDEVVHLTAHPLQGFVFLRWDIEIENMQTPTCEEPVTKTIIPENNHFVMPVGNVTVTAVFEETVLHQYTIHYDAGGGTGIMADDFVLSGESHTVEQNLFTRSGYAFSHWRNLATGINYNAGDLITNISQDITLTAQWSAKTVEVISQLNFMLANVAGNVAEFAIATTNIPNGTYSISVANRPAGVAISGMVTIENNAGRLRLLGSANANAGTFHNLTLTIDGAVSQPFTLTVVECIPQFTLPENLTATNIQFLNDVELPGGWQWLNPDHPAGIVGINMHLAIFTSEDDEEECKKSIQLSLPVLVKDICACENMWTGAEGGNWNNAKVWDFLEDIRVHNNMPDKVFNKGFQYRLTGTDVWSTIVVTNKDYFENAVSHLPDGIYDIRAFVEFDFCNLIFSTIIQINR